MNYVFVIKNSAGNLILNVDNPADKEILKIGGAYEMPAEMVSSIFGENSRYANNTTCIVTDNSENPVFPFTVTFDASKIDKTEIALNKSNGNVKLLETRIADATVTLTDLVIGKPVYIILGTKIGKWTNSAVFVSIKKGSLDVFSTGFQLGSTSQNYGTNTAVFIPNASTAVIGLDFQYNDLEVRFYQ